MPLPTGLDVQIRFPEASPPVFAKPIRECPALFDRCGGGVHIKEGAGNCCARLEEDSDKPNPQAVFRQYGRDAMQMVN